MKNENDVFFVNLEFLRCWNMDCFSDYYCIFSYNLCRNCSNPKIKGAVVFYEQGPQSFDYSIRLNHTWAFSGFPDVTTIMDTNGPFLNDLELGVSAVPTMQYSFSGFFTVWLLSSHADNFSFHSSLLLPIILPLVRLYWKYLLHDQYITVVACGCVFYCRNSKCMSNFTLVDLNSSRDWYLVMFLTLT